MERGAVLDSGVEIREGCTLPSGCVASCYSVTGGIAGAINFARSSSTGDIFVKGEIC